MLKKANRSTAVLVKEKLVDAQIVDLPIDSKTISVIFDWFDEEEISLANAKADGEAIDESYLEYIFIAVDVIKGPFALAGIVHPFSHILRVVGPYHRTFSVFFVCLPCSFIPGTCLPGIDTFATTHILLPLPDVNVPIMIIHGTLALLIVGIPHAFVAIVVLEMESAPAVLLVLEPFAHILLAIVKQIGSFALTLAHHVFALILVTVLEHGTTFAVRKLALHFANIYGAVFEFTAIYLVLRRSTYAH